MKNKNKIKKPFYKRWWFIALVIIFVIGVIGSSDDDEEVVKNESSQIEQDKLKDTNDKQEVAKEEKELAETSDEVAKEEKELAETSDEVAKGERELAEASEDVAKEEVDYSRKVGKQANEWSKLWFNLSDLMNDAKVGQDDWTLEVVTVLQQMKDVIEQARDLNPPKKFEQVNVLYMKSVDNYEVVTNELPTAIDNNDANHISKITESIEEGNNYMDEASNLVLKLNENN